MSEEPPPRLPPYSLGALVQQAKSAAKSLREGSKALEKLSTDTVALVAYLHARNEYRDALDNLTAETQDLIEAIRDISPDAHIADALANTTRSLDRALRVLDKVEARR